METLTSDFLVHLQHMWKDIVKEPLKAKGHHAERGNGIWKRYELKEQRMMVQLNDGSVGAQ